MASTASATAGHGHAASHGGPTPPADALMHHFPNLAVQNEAVKLGMWLFLSTEILLFAGLFIAYAVYRQQFPEDFAQASRHINLTLGTVNTVVLITSSLTVALAIHFARSNQKNAATLCLVLTLVAAFAFLGIKTLEYMEKFHEGALPGRYYTFHEVPLPGAPMYFTIYFLTTGLHALHVVIGMTVLAVLTVKTAQGRFSSAYYTGLEIGGLYWHLVDLVWIFLYPLLYLI